MAYTKPPDRELLEAALAGYQHQYEVLGKRIAEVRRLLGGRGVAPITGGESPKRIASEATRRRMTRSQKPGVARAKKRKMSAEGRKRIAGAARKRWAEYRARKAAH